MKPSRQILAMMTQVITLQRNTGVARDGTKLYGPPIVAKGFITKRARQVRDSGGDIKISMVQVTLDAVYGLNPKDKIILPDLTAPVILTISMDTAPDGTFINETVYT